jgi:endonuclease III related protein
LDQTRQIRSYFEALRKAWGPQNWWPAESPFEVIAGAVLTQNTAWTNVEKALGNLRRNEALSVGAIRAIELAELEKLVQPAGFFRQKAARLKRFVGWLDERYEAALERMFAQPTAKLRSELLGINGIGPETADSILLYAGQHEIFVVDAYTRRIFERHSLITADTKYDEIREMIERGLRMPVRSTTAVRIGRLTAVEPGPGPAKETTIPSVHQPSRMSGAPRSKLAQEYNEFHALIVQVGKHYCQSRVARCEECPLRVYLNGKTVKGKTAK